MINVHSETMDGDHLASIIVEVNNLALNNNVRTESIMDYLKKKIHTEETECMKHFYADTLAYVNYISGKAVDDLLIATKPIPMCLKRDRDICSMYCDGFDTSCEMYQSSEKEDDVYIGTCSRFEDDDCAIEVCSFEDGDPQ
jgi:hypothetical protein